MSDNMMKYIIFNKDQHYLEAVQFVYPRDSYSYFIILLAG